MEYGIWNFHGGLWPANTIAALNGATLTPVTALPANGGGGAVSFAIAASAAALLNPTTDDIDNNTVGQSDTSIDQNTTESTSSEPANNESQTQTDSVFASDLSNACDDNAVDNHNMKIENQIGLLAQQFHPVYNLIFGQLNGQQTEQISDSDESSDNNNETNETSSNQFKLKSTKVSSCEIIPLYGEQPTTSREGSSDSKTTCNDTDAEPTPHHCPVSGCEFRATFREELDRHVLAHEDKALKHRRGLSMQRIRYEREEYHCSLCPYTCTTERAYLRHLRLHSLGTAPQNRLSCAVCGRDRSSEASMAKHMRKHRDDRYFCCDLCTFRTVQLKKLIQHRRMHTGEKPHLCPHCAYRSARRDNLRSHVRRVHKRPNLICDTFSPRGMLLTPSVKPSTSSREIAADENEDDADV